MRVGVERLAEPGAAQLEADAAPRAAALRAAAGCRGRRRCSSGRGRARRRAGRSATEDHHLGADVLGRLGDVAQRPRPRRPCAARLLGQPAGGDDVRAGSRRRLGRALAVRADALADRARSATPSSIDADRDRLGDVASSRRPRRGRARGAAASPSKASSVGGDRERDAAAGRQRAARARRRSRVARRRQQLDRLHRHGDRAPNRPAERRSRRRRRRRRDVDAAASAARSLERGEQRRASRSSAVTVVPGARRGRSATRPVPAPTSSTAAGRVARELAPQRQVGVVAAALDVVPDHVRGRSSPVRLRLAAAGRAARAARAAPCRWGAT